MPHASMLVCSACGAAAAPDDPYPFRCPAAQDGDDVDHLLVRRLTRPPAAPVDHESHPLLRWRGLLHSHVTARAAGMPEAAWHDLVLGLDARIQAVDGRGLSATPFARHHALSDALGFSGQGGVWVKDERGQVAGSHKARHLAGIAVWLEVMEQLGRTSPLHRPALVIASCGNAALAAAVLAHAMRWPLRVFVPRDADLAVLTRLADLAARIEMCARAPGDRGDPCVHAMRRAVDAGAIPFTCQGSENGLAIDAGATLACELAEAAAVSGTFMHRVFVQVGGGALASACVQGFHDMFATGTLRNLPRLHAVQTRGCAPLARAFERVRARIDAGATRSEVLADAARRRSRYMWPWDAPHGAAGGILDDETYDWRAVVAGMLESDGAPVVVDDADIREGHRLAAEAGVPASATGAAGLSGLLVLRRSGEIAGDERVAVLLTGAAQ